MSSEINRIILIVMDSVGIGALPDAAEYGDEGSNTICNTAKAVSGLNLPALQDLGLGNIAEIEGVNPVAKPTASFGKMSELSKGKDTITGHWEMMGIITEIPFPVYPNGFPDNVIKKFEQLIGRETLGNKAASGTQIINELGDEHIRTGKPIVYTSADSVFQLACHEEVISVETLYDFCSKARKMLTHPHHVQRVIARPFIGKNGVFQRTERRRDFSVEPTGTTLLDLLVNRGDEVIGIGKIEDIFNNRGITKSFHTNNNPDSIDQIVKCIKSNNATLIFANLVDFDMLYGHRNDARGYAKALEHFDSRLPEIIASLKDKDLLIITADHGCDPTTASTDHSREYVPLLVFGKMVKEGVCLGVRKSFSDIAVSISELLNIDHSFIGESFIDAIF